MAVVGLRFGGEFVPIYQHHPVVDSVVVCDSDRDVLQAVGEKFAVPERVSDLSSILADPSVDAVHLVTPFTVHAKQSIAALRAGKHTACTVPMGLSLEELKRVITAQRTSGCQYMMMETAVFTREFLYARDLVDRGELGQITYGRGAHFQDMEGWPAYWRGLPPMYYMTHAVSPLLALLRTRARSVRCLGGARRPQHESVYGNPFAVETALFDLVDSEVVIDVARSLYSVARPYTESFSLYGDRAGFEWPQLEDGQPALRFSLGTAEAGRGRPVSVEEVVAPDRHDLLPSEIAPFTIKAGLAGAHPALDQGGGHGGSHPHLVHAFVSSVVENRRSPVDAITAANWTAAGLCAHMSALEDGKPVGVPRFD